MDEKKLGSRLLYILASCDLTFVAWAELVWAIFRDEAWPLGENAELFSVQAFYHDSDVGEFVEVSLADKVLSCVQGFGAKKIKFIVNEHLPAIPNVAPKDAWAVLHQGQLEQQKAERMVRGLQTPCGKKTSLRSTVCVSSAVSDTACRQEKHVCTELHFPRAA